MTILTEGHKLWPEYSLLQKCGSVALGEDFNLLGLNCYFCPTIVTHRMDDFRKHIQKHHSKELTELYAAFETKEETLKNNLFDVVGSDEEIAIKIEPHLFMDDDGVDCVTDPMDESKTDVENDIFDHMKEDTQNFLEKYEKDDEKDDEKDKSCFEIATPSTSKKRTRAKRDSIQKLETSSSSINYKESDSEDELYAHVDEDYKPENEFIATCNLEEDEYKPAKHKKSNESELESDGEDGEADSEDNPAELECKNKKKLAPKIDINLSENHGLVLHIIDFYEKNTHLWNSTQREYRKRHITLNALGQQLQQTFQIQLEPVEIERIFKKLRSDFRSYSRRNPTEEQSLEPKMWYYNKLLFLPSSKITKNRLSSSEFIQKISKLFQNYPTLWNMDDETSSNKKLRQKALERLFQELSIDCSMSELKVAVSRMKNEYAAEKTKRLKCEVENKPFEPKNSELYNQLYFIDNYIGPLRCQYCNQTFRFYEQFQIHVAAHEERKPFSCKYCQKPYSTLIGLHQHTMREHNTTEKCYPCNHCDKSFYSASDLKSHKNSHVEEMRFVCELCGKFFHSKNYYTDHLAKHNKKYKCSLCPMEYSDKYRFDAHMNSHNKIRAFVCNICGKGFYSQKTMGQHKLLHGNVEKYECNLCGRKFKQVAAMHSHKKWFHQKLNSTEKLC